MHGISTGARLQHFPNTDILLPLYPICSLRMAFYHSSSLLQFIARTAFQESEFFHGGENEGRVRRTTFHGVKSLASHRRGQGQISDQFIWDLWGIQWHLGVNCRLYSSAVYQYISRIQKKYYQNSPNIHDTLKQNFLA